MEIFYHTVSLAILAFLLGACPFAVWIGQWLAGKNIRDYGDGNPGTVNVFRSGGVKLGLLAVVFEAAKGFPFVYLAQAYYKLPIISVIAVATFALLGHAFSPFLRFRGGKALAVTLGVLLAMPHYELVIAFIGFTALGFLFIKVDAWVVIFGATCSLIFFLITKGLSWESLLVICILTVWVIKHFADLHSVPGLKLKPVIWFRSRRITRQDR